MASNTMQTWNRRKRRHRNLGRKRKNAESRHSTPSQAELFAGMGEPGQPAPAPKRTSKPAKSTAAKSTA